jgi:hypothetical protein
VLKILAMERLGEDQGYGTRKWRSTLLFKVIMAINRNTIIMKTKSQGRR